MVRQRTTPRPQNHGSGNGFAFGADEMYRTPAHHRPNTIAVNRQRPSRLSVGLAIAWMVLSLAIGGAVTADSGPDATGPATTIIGVTQP